jgi:hypothetical protein
MPEAVGTEAGSQMGVVVRVRVKRAAKRRSFIDSFKIITFDFDRTIDL